ESNKMFEIFKKPHADSWLQSLAFSPGPILIIITCYLLVIFKTGRCFMKYSPPDNRRRGLQVYSLLQACSSISMLVPGLYFMVAFHPYNLSCMKALPQDHPLKSWERVISYAYYIHKIIDLLDAFFIVLRKKYDPISFSLLFRHGLLPFAGSLIVRYVGYKDHTVLLCCIGVSVQIGKYCYYCLSLAGRRVPWKRYLTLLQMVQFLLTFMQCVYNALQPGCETSPGILFIFSCSSAIIWIIFCNF
ncbi:hypothetical protein KR018_008936, partial [Drosophila ironensis]